VIERNLGRRLTKLKMEILDGQAGHEQESAGRRKLLKSKEQANRADLFFGWNRVDKTH